jgi:hypothetical protein
MSFKDVNPVINAYMQKSEMHMQDGIMFVVLSIKTPFHTMSKQMQDYRKYGLSSKYVWGFKKQTLEYLLENRSDLYRRLMAAYRIDMSKNARDRWMMEMLTQVPGLGLVKAGFVMQMMFGRVGCIDVHNSRRFRKVTPKDLQFSPTAKFTTRLQKIDNYIEICKGHRSTSKLWDQWCDLIADKHCNHFNSGWDVSKYHLEALVGVTI